MAKKVILLGLALLLALVPIGCGSDSDNSDDDDDGVVNVYAESSDASADFGSKAPSDAAAVAGLQALNITFDSLVLRQTDGTNVTVIDETSDVNTVDLVAALNDPTLLASFNVPPGDYNGLEGSIDVITITDAEGETCPVDEDISFGPIVSPQTITVDDTGTVGIDVDFPVLGGDCVGGVGTVNIGEAEVRPHAGF